MRLFLLACAAVLVTGCASTAPLAPKAIALNDQGAKALQADDLEHAEAELGLALEYNPRFTEAWVNLGLVEMRLGRFEKAHHHFRKAIELNPDLPAPFHGRGLLEERMGETEKAEKSYREALKVDPGFGPARVNLGRILFARRDYDGAREQFLRLTEVAPGVVEGWSGLVEAMLRLHREHEADALLDTAREKLGERPVLALLVARRLLREGDASSAVAALDPITRDGNPKIQAAAFAWLAVARAVQGDVEASHSAAHKALELDPNNDVALYATKVRTNLD
ncbi:MAG TPA: tetratricopeptide repeat protein [Polyangiaceae bacterium]|jgi:tetratricopeptide (TPR) repeat protein|nr:tetratricopeptide repeat protein [Polyangiaceae bacterium]